MPVWSRNDDENLPSRIGSAIRRMEAEEQKKHEEDNHRQIVSLLEELKTKMDKQNELLIKVASLTMKMYRDGEINKDTFNKLDAFLKPYYDDPYQDGSF